MAGLGNYSSALLRSLLENPVLPTVLPAFKINTEREADRMKTVFHVHLLARMKLYLPYRQGSIIRNTLRSDITNLTSRELKKEVIVGRDIISATIVAKKPKACFT